MITTVTNCRRWLVAHARTPGSSESLPDIRRNTEADWVRFAELGDLATGSQEATNNRGSVQYLTGLDFQESLKLNEKGPIRKE